MPKMNIQVMQTVPVTASLAVLDDPKLYSLIEDYLLLVPSPSDEQVHALALALGLDAASFESALYTMFGELLQAVQPEEDSIESSDEIGRLAEHDGYPDEEALGHPDPLKEASESDGPVDEEPFLNLQP